MFSSWNLLRTIFQEVCLPVDIALAENDEHVKNFVNCEILLSRDLFVGPQAGESNRTPIHEPAPSDLVPLGCRCEISRFAVKIGLFDMRWRRHFALLLLAGTGSALAVGVSLAYAEPAGPGHRSRTVFFSDLPPGPSTLFGSGRDHVACVRPLPGILSRWIRRNRKLSDTRLPLASRPLHQAASGRLFVPHRPRRWPRYGRDSGEHILLSFDHWSCFRRSLWLARILCLATVKRVSLLVGVLDHTSHQH